MAITGRLIKGAIHFQQMFTQEKVDGIKEQIKQLRELLESAKDTSFGKFYGFSSIMEHENPEINFVKKVPIHDYDSIFLRWWFRAQEGEEDICWPGKVDFFALSSGTTGKESKRIPITYDMIEAIRKTSISQILSLDQFDLPPDFFEKDILLFGSSTSLKSNGIFKEGEISGISAANIPEWFSNYYKPGKEIAGIDDWEEKVDKIIIKAKDWDIGAMAGIPAWLQIVLKKIIDHYKLNTIHDLWPNLQVYASGGVAFEPFRKNFEKLFGRSVHIVDTYLASEGYFAYQSRPQVDSMRLVLDNRIFYEFLPFNAENFDSEGNIIGNPQTILIDEIEEGVDYALIISTCSGAWRYLLGDTIRFTNKEEYEIVITGRTKHFLNVAGSQLSVEKLNAGVNMLQNEYNIKVSDFLVSAIEYNDGFAHKWYIGCEDKFDKENATIQLDQFLKEINKNYKVARERSLKKIIIEVIPSEYFYQYHKIYKQAGGQSKTPRVMNKEQFEKFESLVNKLKESKFI
jgi:hypothetical protein